MGRRQLKIGYINQDFPPEVGAGPARILEMSLAWRRSGAEVTVITGMPNRRLAGMDDGAIHPSYRGQRFMQESWDGIRVLRSWVYTSQNRGFAHVLANNASFMASSVLHTLYRAPRLDVAIASSPPFLAHVTGEVIRRARRIPLVLEIRDLWPDYMVEMGVLNNRAAQRMLFGLERNLIHRADHLVVVTDSFKSRLVGKGADPNRIDVIPNGVDLDAYHSDQGLDRTGFAVEVPQLQRSGTFRVGYLGNFGAGQDLRVVLDAAKRVHAIDPDIRIVLVGDGREKPLVLEHARQLHAPNVEIHPPIEKRLTRAFYNSCDACLVPLAPIPIFAETVPSKLFEIMACERPVIASVAGEAARIVHASACGVVTDPGDAKTLAVAILELRRTAPDVRAAMGTRGRAYVSQHYSRAALAQRYLGILERVVERAAISR
jgi:colanic acid biosynthesis glycosyl transferase WcaI